MIRRRRPGKHDVAFWHGIRVREVNSKQRLLHVLKIPMDLPYNIVIDLNWIFVNRICVKLVDNEGNPAFSPNLLWVKTG